MIEVIKLYFESEIAFKQFSFRFDSKTTSVNEIEALSQKLLIWDLNQIHLKW